MKEMKFLNNYEIIDEKARKDIDKISQEIIELKSDENLTTTDKTIVGAINEVNTLATELNSKHTEGTDSLILLSPNGTRFSITIGDDGVLSATEITE